MDPMLGVLSAAAALASAPRVTQLRPMMVDVDGKRRSLCLEIPTSPLQPNNTIDDAMVDVWNCDSFTVNATNSKDGRDKWVQTDEQDFELQSVATARNMSQPKCLS